MEKLVHLGEVAFQVAKMVSNLEDVITPGQFNGLESLLDDLQRAAPVFPAVIDARVRWFLHGLKSFEVDFVERVEAAEVGWGDFEEAQQLLMTPENIDKFLTRAHLGDRFPEVFEKVEELYGRLASPGDPKDELWQARYEKLHLDLLKGRF